MLVKGGPGNKIQRDWNSYIFIQGNAPQGILCEIAAILPEIQCVNKLKTNMCINILSHQWLQRWLQLWHYLKQHIIIIIIVNVVVIIIIVIIIIIIIIIVVIIIVVVIIMIMIIIIIIIIIICT